MNTYQVYLETGKKRTFACAVDWPGWCRSGRDEQTALHNLVAYGSRYADALQESGISFLIPSHVSDLRVSERLAGNATTEYGAPGIIPDADNRTLAGEDFAQLLRLLEVCWKAFDNAAGKAKNQQLRKGPRGGGRDMDKIIQHVLESDLAYLLRLAWKWKPDPASLPVQKLKETRQVIREALASGVHEGLPQSGTRGGQIWPVRYFIRRAAWHVLDHAWEIEDRYQKPS
jgi:hypothetical protein